MESPLIDIIRYLVVRQLAGSGDIVKIIYEYFAKGESPVALARKYNVSKHAVRGYAQRINEKTRNFAKSRAIVRFVAPLVMRIEPVAIEINEKMFKCRICGEELLKPWMTRHVEVYHREVVEHHVYRIIDELQRMLQVRKV